MSEGLSAVEAGKQVAEHAEAGAQHEDRDRAIAIAEAVLLSIVTLLAAWSGYAAAKWNTESRLALARASAARTDANRAASASLTLRNFDSAAFDAWFAAYAVRNPTAMRVAVHRFRPQLRTAFDAWRATDPESNPRAPRGPTYMPQYRIPDAARATALDRSADRAAAAGDEAGNNSDDYVRTT